MLPALGFSVQTTALDIDVAMSWIEPSIMLGTAVRHGITLIAR